ncbi:hypothetical protein C3747_93g113 [Trypanosoma cruzi]|uniref:Flagellar attachment zone protein 1 conserved domain-containing protein n=2 Tax=Trypanosoma cruzi TaxID=5693 RepID=Q4DK60_TRYCC|nr:hypothetical protein, conserved [Trypanosoma cruzi]EAN92914.1 hypothetical protein, conserved [Trypanosoma cruzi]KAF8292269.1 hypothetical protein TcYC6_0117590 [Trypanosoma cruzi]PWV08175.1 hypothetical protein C3747_93g113 [Trypanosoma cruzi]RNC58481.1 hypothetical protein TcCL_ESM03945 [Trypanosoma cruzi]|eukprot:XP_814765.1 hypothetical protein [Trypanosoma cruzi strain CL Brener]
MIVEGQLEVDEHHNAPNGAVEESNSKHTPELHDLSKEGSDVPLTGTSGNGGSAPARVLSLRAQSTESGTGDKGKTIPAPRQTSDDEVQKTPIRKEEAPKKADSSARSFSDCGSDPPEAAAMAPVPTPQPSVNAAAVTTYKKTFEGSQWASLLSSMHDTVMRTLLNEASMATGLPDTKIRVVEMKMEGDSTLFTEISLVHDSTKSAEDMDHALNAYAFEGMKQLLEMRSFSENRQPTNPNVTLQGKATLSKGKTAAAAADDDDNVNGVKKDSPSGVHVACLNAADEAATNDEETVTENTHPTGSPKKTGVVMRGKVHREEARTKKTPSPTPAKKGLKKQKVAQRGKSPTEKMETSPLKGSTPRRAFTPRGVTTSYTEANTSNGPFTPRGAAKSYARASTPNVRRSGKGFLPFSSKFITTLSPHAARLQYSPRPVGRPRTAAAAERETPRRRGSARASPLRTYSASRGRSSEGPASVSKQVANTADSSGIKRPNGVVNRGGVRPIPPQRVIRVGLPTFPRTPRASAVAVSFLPEAQEYGEAEGFVGTDHAVSTPVEAPPLHENDGEPHEKVAAMTPNSVGFEQQ